MKAICENPSISIDLNGNMRLMFDVLPESKHVKYSFGEISTLERIEVTAGAERKQRSLDANAYCWVLLGKLSAKLGIPKDDLYQQAIRMIGDSFEIVPIKDSALESWIRIWTGKGLGWTCTIEQSKLPGYKNVVCYYGSSVYDRKQMSALIDFIVGECEAQGIETLSLEKLALLKEGWDAK